MVLGIFNVGNTELLVILIVALLMFGGRLPDVARSLGKSVNMFKKGLKDVEDDINSPDLPAAPPKSLPPPAPTNPVATPTNETTKSQQN